MLVQDIYNLNIFIDDLNLFEAPGVVFNNADIYESIANPVPVMTMEMIIPNGWMDGRTLSDGTKIKIQIQCETLDLDAEYTFRLYNIKELEVMQNNVRINLEGILDFYDGYSSGNTYNLCGTSSEVFQKIAGTFGLNADIDSTNDKQLWVAGQKNIYQFFTYLAAYGWIDETSGMFWCLDKNKTLLYKNLTTLFRNRQDKVYSFVQTPVPDKKNKEFGYSGVKGSIQAGTNNLRNDGYGGSDSYFDLKSYSWKQAKANKVVAESNIINVSKDLSKGLSQEWFSFDVGNHHANYFKAYKQNRRVLSTYSTYATLTTEFLQKYRLGEIVNLEYIDSKNVDNKLNSLSGTYMIDAIHSQISLNNISGIVEMVMQGLNGKATTQENY